MEVSGQLHDPAALSPGKESLVSITFSKKETDQKIKFICEKSDQHSACLLLEVEAELQKYSQD
jgi:hypothetical protein